MDSASTTSAMRDQPHQLPADAFLDRWFEHAVSALESGTDPSWEEWFADRSPELRTAGAALLELARSVSIGDRTRIGPTAATRIPGYRLVSELGRGSMGSVWLARQERLGGRSVALKLLPGAFALTERARARFRDEAAAIARLRHPNVVAVHDVVNDGDLLAFAMEVIDGPSLAEVIRRAVDTAPGSPTIPSGHAAAMIRVGIGIARALGAVHRSGLVHRDIKPSNILIRSDGTALLADFGLVVDDLRRREASETGFAGTLAYAAPEQMRGEPPAPAADLFALGATLFHAFALQPPFRELRHHADVPPRLRSVRPELPRDIDTIIATALEADPARRYGSADALADDLERLLRFEPIRATPAGPLRRLVMACRRHRRAVAAFVGGAISVTIALAIATAALVAIPARSAKLVDQARGILIDAIDSRELYSTVIWAPPDGERPVEATGPSAVALAAAAARYEEALRWWGAPQEARDEWTEVRRRLASLEAGGPPAAPPIGRSDGPRSTGLAALLEGRYGAALQAWGELEERDPSLLREDPLVEAALGVLYVLREEPGRAYPRLLNASRRMPHASTLRFHLAEAAIGCRDAIVAERALDAAPDEVRFASARLRLRARLAALRGEAQEAERLFRSVEPNAVVLTDFVDFLAAAGRNREAMTEARIAARDAWHFERFRRTVRAVAETWWTDASPMERLALVGSALGLFGDDAPQTLLFLGEVVEASSGLAPQERDDAPNGSSAANRRNSAPPAPSVAALLRGQTSLLQLARLMEVDDMQQWSRLIAAPRWIRWTELAALAVGTRSPLAHWWIRRGGSRGVAAGAAALAAASTSVGGESEFFQGLGDLPGGAFESHVSSLKSLSADGSMVVGRSAGAGATWAFLWTASTGMVSLGTVPGGEEGSFATSISADGATIVGASIWNMSGCLDRFQGWRWTAAEGMIALGDLPGGCAYSLAMAASDDGQTIVGVSIDRSNQYSASAWTPGTGWFRVAATSYSSSFTAISADGGTFYGARALFPGSFEFVMVRSIDGGIEDLGDLAGGSVGSYSYDTTAAGDVLVGYGTSASGLEAVRWTAATGVVALPPLSGGTSPSIATGISADGTAMVGFTTTPIGSEAVIWIGADQPVRVVDFLAAGDVGVPEGWTLATCSDVTLHCGFATLAGDGINPDGQDEGWIARRRIAPPCPADLDCDRDVDGADLATLLGSWGFCIGCDPDLDGNGAVDGADLAVLLGSWGSCD